MKANEKQSRNESECSTTTLVFHKTRVLGRFPFFLPPSFYRYKREWPLLSSFLLEQYTEHKSLVACTRTACALSYAIVQRWIEKGLVEHERKRHRTWRREMKIIPNFLCTKTSHEWIKFVNLNDVYIRKNAGLQRINSRPSVALNDSLLLLVELVSTTTLSL